MKAILNVVALCAVIALVGCNNSNKTVSPGAVGEKSGCCSEGKAAGGCCSGDKSKSTSTDGTNMGAVSDQKSGCTAGKSACPHAAQNSTTGN